MQFLLDRQLGHPDAVGGKKELNRHPEQAFFT